MRIPYSEILARLREYDRQDPAEARKELVRRWQTAHPEAVQETSSALKPLILYEGYRKSAPNMPDECWHNDTYHVTVRRHARDPVFGTRGGMIQLGISSLDGTARHDWRDFQAIKNQLAGPEVEGFELYPADSRLLDPSNYYSLWCFPGVKRLKVGGEDKIVLDIDEAIAPQRKFREE